MSVNELQYAGQFEILTCELITGNGNSVNLRASVIDINFYEDIFKSSITGNITCFASDDILSQAQIIGQERLRLRIKTPSKPDNEDIDFENEPLIVHRVSGKVQLSQNGNAFTLHFISADMLKNQQIRVSQSYKKEISSIVESVLTDEIQTQREVTVEKTLGIRSLVIPNLHPYDAIRMVTTEALSESTYSPHYLFFETLSGFHFRSIQDLYNQEVVIEYNSGVGNLHTDDVAPHRNIQYQFQKVLDFKPIPSFDTLKNVTSGMLGSKLHLHDIFTKQYHELEHKYFDNFKDFKRTNSINNPVYSDIEDIGNYPDAKIHLHPTSRVPLQQEGTYVDGHHVSADENVENIISNQIENSLLSRQSRLFELGQPVRGVLLTVNGFTGLHAGDVVNFTKTPKEVNIDGKYLIKNTNHYFDVASKRHDITLQCVADSVETIIE